MGGRNPVMPVGNKALACEQRVMSLIQRQTTTTIRIFSSLLNGPIDDFPA
jgi:hypothetical protein